MITAKVGQGAKRHRLRRRLPRSVQRDDRESPRLPGRIEGSPLRQLAGWMANGLRAAGDRLYAAPDRQARAHGWQITVRRGGLGRGYRDPRFDMLVSCPDCHGAGADDQARPCRHCSGTGRLNLDRRSRSGTRSQP